MIINTLNIPEQKLRDISVCTLPYSQVFVISEERINCMIAITFCSNADR